MKLKALQFLAAAAAASMMMMTEARPSATDIEIEGPAKDSPLVQDSESLEPDMIPMEHRQAGVTGAIVLPDTEGVPVAIYEKLGIDTFFSLWFVFLNNEKTVSGESINSVFAKKRGFRDRVLRQFQTRPSPFWRRSTRPR